MYFIKKLLRVLGSITFLSTVPIPIMAIKIISLKNQNKQTDLDVNLNNDKNSKKIIQGRVKKPISNITRRSSSLKKVFAKIKKSSNFSSENRTHPASKYGTYINFLRESTNYFEITKNVEKLEGVINTNYPNKKVFKLKNGIDKHKIIPLSNENHEIELVFDTSNLYLEGIINIDKNHKKTYWYFSDSKIKNLDNNITSESLHFSGNYSNLVGEDTIEISRKDINNSISNLSNITKENRHTIKNDLVRTVFITSESMRFFSVRDSIKKILIDDNKKVIWQDHKDTLNDWGKYSKKYYEMIKTGIIPENEEEKIINIAILAPKDYEK